VPFQRVKELKDIELFYASTVDTTVTVSTDMPGGTVAVRKTLNFPNTSGTRKTLTLPLDIEGTLFKVRAAPGLSGIAKLFGGIVRARAIGVYLDGANGEFWESQEQGVGI
jgi:hypothetical protein